jgi:hypothetical protein
MGNFLHHLATAVVGNLVVVLPLVACYVLSGVGKD